MPNFREWFNRLRHLGRRSSFDTEVSDEFRFHIETRAAELHERGLSPSDAMRQARLEFGSISLAREDSRAPWRFQFFEHLAADLRFGLRMLRRSPSFSLLVILCLTLGIGANAAVFSWIEGILLRPYPLVVNQDTMFAIAGTERGTRGSPDMSWPDFVDLQKNCTLFDAFIAEKITGTTLSIGDRAERATGSIVSANYFDALGVRPILGRGFEPAENVGRNAHPVTVISYQLWQGRFQADPQIIGKSQILDGVPFTIIGVAPKGFFGTFVGYAFQFWVPVSMQATFDPTGYKLEDRGARWIEGFVRLKPGVTMSQAQQEISAVTQRLEADYPATNRGHGAQLFPLWKTPFNNAGALLPALGISLAVVIFVLLIACANVANLLLVRSFARRREMTVRLAIGAGATRLLQQLLTEGLILSVIAAAGGLLVAHWLRNALVFLIPFRGVPMYVPGQIDWRVLALSVAVCLVSTLLFGLIPALQAGKIDIAGALKSESVVGGGRRTAWVRSTLVIVQVSLSFILLVGAGLVIQSLQSIRTASPGFSTGGVLTTAINLFAAGYDAPRAKLFQDDFLTRVQSLPGVASAAYSRIIPFSYSSYSSSPVAVDGYQPPPDEQPEISYDEVSPGYFATMQIPLVAGREFTRADNESAPLVAIVNEPLAALYWRGQDPVGKRLEVKGRWRQIVGVAKLSKYRNFLETQQPFFYVPLRQNPATLVGLVLRTSQPPAAIAPALAREVHALDPGLATYQVITMREQVDRSTSNQRIAVTLLTVFGSLALLLAAIGLYGVMSYAVSQSTLELGLRMALGARASDLLRLVLSHGLRLTATGLILGLAAALALTRLLGYILYNVSRIFLS